MFRPMTELLAEVTCRPSTFAPARLPSNTISGPKGFVSPPKAACVRPSMVIAAAGLLIVGRAERGLMTKTSGWASPPGSAESDVDIAQIGDRYVEPDRARRRGDVGVENRLTQGARARIQRIVDREDRQQPPIFQRFAMEVAVVDITPRGVSPECRGRVVKPCAPFQKTRNSMHDNAPVTAISLMNWSAY